MAGVLALAPAAAHPLPVEAHARLVASRPAPGEMLGLAPGAVVLEFSEPVSAALSRASVEAPGGRRFGGSPAGDREIRVELTTNAPGVYGVDWVAISAVDGHALRGGFRFGVKVRPDATVQSGSPSPPDLAAAAGHVLEYTGLLFGVGGLLLRALARRRPRLPWASPPLAAGLATALVGGLTGLVAGVLSLDSGVSWPTALAYLGSSAGRTRLVGLAAEAAALAFWAARLPVAVGVALLAAIASLAAAGHAASAAPPLAVPADTVHLLAAGAWAGCILVLALLRPPGGWLGPEGRRLLSRFWPVALGSFGAVAATGMVRAGQELRGLADLWSTSYGRLLLLKSAVVLAMAGLSALAWRRRLLAPRLEAALAVAVLGATALLAAQPLPPVSLSQAPALGAEEASQGLPREGDLTLGDHAGSYLVGLTLRPGRPGPNTAWIFVLPVEGELAAAGVPVRVVAAGAGRVADACGLTCRRVDLDLQGAGDLRVEVGGSEGGSATFSLPRLPAAAGQSLLALEQARMHRLRTYRMDETLGSGRVTVHTSYESEAPDRLHVSVEGGEEIVAVGPVRYAREGQAAPWTRAPSVALRTPFFDWDFGPARAPRVVAAGDGGGGAEQVVSFFEGGSTTPTWYRLWVDGDGLTRQAEMMAQGHFMVQHYADFDASFTIETPGT